MQLNAMGVGKAHMNSLDILDLDCESSILNLGLIKYFLIKRFIDILLCCIFTYVLSHALVQYTYKSLLNLDMVF